MEEEGIVVREATEKGTFYLLLSNTIFFLTGYFIYFILARLLQPAEFGLYGVIIALISILNLVLVTGIQQAVSKFVSETPENALKVKRKALILQFSMALIVAIVYVLLAQFVALLLNDLTLTIFLQFSAVIIVTHSLFSVFSGYFNGLKLFKIQATTNAFYYVLKLFLIVGIVWLGYGLFGAITGFIIASTLALIFSIVYAKKIKLKVSKKVKPPTYTKMVNFALPLIGFALLLHLLQNIDLFAVKALVGKDIANELTGYYLAATTISKLPFIFVLAFSSVLFPLISRSTFKSNLKKTQNYIKESMRYSLMILLPLSVLFASTALPLIELLFSEAYSAGGEVLSVLAFSTLFLGLFVILTTIISASGKPKHSFALILVVLVVDLILNILFVPVIGIMGAAFATLISMFLGMIIAGLMVLYYFKALISIVSTMKILIASAIIYILSLEFYADGLFLIVKLIVLLAVYKGLLFVFREFKAKDFKIIKGIVK
ncbi:MAG: oligosaccharide flippase family protein [archaeon]